MPDDSDKSLFDIGLEVLGPALAPHASPDPEANLLGISPESPGIVRQAAFETRRDYALFLKSDLTRRQREAVEDIAWRCDICKTINGFTSLTLNVRKTCRKCKQYRNKSRRVVDILLDEFKLETTHVKLED